MQSDQLKKDLITVKFAEILTALGMDLTDDSVCDTPRRLAKMYVDEIFYGMNEDAFPKITTVENKFNYDQMLIESNIKVNSICEHHLVPIIGAAHVAYIPKTKILGLSKFNRIVDYYSRRPQVQERLTNDIIERLKQVLETPDVAVVIDASHFCVRLRGIQDQTTVTRTSALGGAFRENEVRSEFYSSIPKSAPNICF